MIALRNFALVGLVLTFSASAGRAQTFTWNQTAGGAYNWFASNPWDTNPFVGGTGVTANLTANITGAVSVTLDNPTTVNLLNVGSGTSTFGYTVQGANTLTFGGTNPALVMTAGAVNQAVNVPIAATAAFAVTNNSVAGALSLGGNVSFAANNMAVGGAGNVTFGGTLAGTPAIDGSTATFTKTGAGKATFTNANAFGVFDLTTPANITSTVGNIAVNGGELQLVNLFLNAEDDATGAVGSGIPRRTLAVAAGGKVTVTGTLYINPDNDVYTTAISGTGTLQLRNAAATRATPSLTWDYVGRNADPWGSVISIPVDVGTGAAQVLTGGANRNDVGRYAGDLRFEGALTGSAPLQFQGFNLSNGAGGDHNSHMVIRADNSTSFTSEIRIANIDLILAANNALTSANAVTFNSTVITGSTNRASLFLYGRSFTIGSLDEVFVAGTTSTISNGSRTGVAGGGTNTNNNSATGGVALGVDANSVLTITQSTAGTFSGVIGDGPNDTGTGSGITGYNTLAVVKAGSARLTLAGNNTYTGGTTINAGVLFVTGQTGTNTGTGSVTVNSGGTLGGTGIAGATGTGLVTVKNGGRVLGGDGVTATGSPTLTLAGGLTFENGGHLQAGVGGPAAAAVNGKVASASTFNRTNTGDVLAIDLFNDGTLVNGQSYSITLATYASTNTTASNYSINTVNFSFSGSPTVQVNTGSLILQFTPVPEPMAAFGLAALGLVVGRGLRRSVNVG